MKKHIIVTAVLLVIFAGILGSVLIWRAGMDEGNSSNTEKTETENVAEKQDTQEEMPVVPETENIIGEAASDTTLLFTGDILLRSYFKEHYPSKGINCVISEDLQAEMVNADITMVNQEFPFSTRGVPMENKQYTFRLDPSYVTALNDVGIDIVTLANNHVLDYGKDALSDTFATLDEAGIRYSGAGESEERAKELQIFEVNGKKIGILSASRVIPIVEWNIENDTPGVFCTYDGTALCEEIKKAKEQCDYVAVYVHWGVEYQEYPEEYQRTLGKQYIDSGADFVVGTHTHCLQGIEYYNGKPIFYGLGNFGFGGNIEKTLAVRVTIPAEGEATCTIIPAREVKGCTVRLEGEEADKLYRYMEEISEGITIDANGVVLQSGNQ